MIGLLLVLFIIGPLSTLLHEVGHGVAALLVTKRPIHIYLGRMTESNRENFNFGRLHFHLQWSVGVGYTYWGTGLSKQQRMFSIAGGPMMSLLLIILFGLLSSVSEQVLMQQLFSVAMTFNIIQFVVSILPIYYPAFLIGRKNVPSDGLQLYQLMKKDIKEVS